MNGIGLGFNSVLQLNDSFLTDLTTKKMMTAEERRIDFYGAGDSRAYDHDEIYLMKEYAKDYHESEVKKFRLGDVVGRSKQLKCECKRATFTRTVDEDFNPMCGKCGRTL